MVAALVFFSIDLLAVLALVLMFLEEFDFSLMIELAFFAWILYYLVIGTRTWFKLKKLPPAEELEMVGFHGGGDGLEQEYADEDEDEGDDDAEEEE